MTSRPRLLAGLLALAASLALLGQPAVAGDLGPYNLGVAVAGPDAVVAGDWIATRVLEHDQGHRDLNGDGDAIDYVLHLVSSRGERAVNVGVATHNFRADERRLLIEVAERHQGLTDLNGDGDWTDIVLHTFDLRTLRLRNYGLAARVQWLGRERALVAVSEAEQGGVDLNGDGDAIDYVFHVVDLRTGNATNLALAAAGEATPSLFNVRGDGDIAATRVSERNQGQDLNGDGDQHDDILMVVDLRRTGEPPRLLGSVSFLTNTVRVSEPWVSFLGGSPGPWTQHVLDTRSGRIRDLGVPVVSNLIAFEGSTLVLAADERDEDLNGDGDRNDQVLHVYDAVKGTLLNVGETVATFDTDGEVVAFLTEYRQLMALTPEGKVVAIDSPTEALRPLVQDRWIFYRQKERWGTDLNGDGDFDDEVMAVFGLEEQAPINLELAVWGTSFSARHCAAIQVQEAGQGRDLNGDGDLDDVVPHSLDPESGRALSLGVDASIYSPSFLAKREASLILLVDERGQGQDLNGDGDTRDRVLANACLKASDRTR